MSVSSLNSTINRLQKERADIQHKLSLESKKESDLNNRIGQISRTIRPNMSDSTLNSKYSEIQRKENEIARVQVKKADLYKKIADKESRLSKAREDLVKEEERERKRQMQSQEREQKRLADLEKRQQQEQLARQKQLQAEIQRTIELSTSVNEIESTLIPHQSDAEFDLFISHASEDKEEFVRPLAETLENLGIKVWYDEFTLRVGDSLRKSIDHGLVKSKFGTVIISSAFCSKNWTQYELDGMVAREMNGHKMILPIWHKVTKDDVINFSPNLADKVALNTSVHSIEEIANQLREVILN